MPDSYAIQFLRVSCSYKLSWHTLMLPNEEPDITNLIGSMNEELEQPNSYYKTLKEKCAELEEEKQTTEEEVDDIKTDIVKILNLISSLQYSVETHNKQLRDIMLGSAPLIEHPIKTEQQEPKQTKQESLISSQFIEKQEQIELKIRMIEDSLKFLKENQQVPKQLVPQHLPVSHPPSQQISQCNCQSNNCMARIEVIEKRIGEQNDSLKKLYDIVSSLQQQISQYNKIRIKLK